VYEEVCSLLKERLSLIHWSTVGGSKVIVDDSGSCKNIGPLFANNSCMARAKDPGDMIKLAPEYYLHPVGIEVLFFLRVLMESVTITTRLWFS